MARLVYALFMTPQNDKTYIKHIRLLYHDLR